MNKLNTKIYLASLDDLGQFCYQRFAELVRADEREACAQLCDEWFASTAGQAIRERGKPSPAFKNYMGDNWSGIV
jgi:hypothetical protein